MDIEEYLKMKGVSAEVWAGHKRSLAQFRSAQLLKCRKSPLVQKRVIGIDRESKSKSSSRAASRVSSPGDALAERDLMVMALAMLDNQIKILPEEGYPEEARQFSLGNLALMAAQAPIFLFRTKPTAAAFAMEMPDHVFGKEGWPYPLMWWTFEDSPPLITNDSTHLKTALQSLLLVQQPDGVIINIITDASFQTLTHELIVTQHLLKFGARLKSGGPEGIPLDTQLLKLVAFLNSKYVCTDAERMSRAERKLLIHGGMPEEAEKEVHIVELRAKEQMAGFGEENEGERDWAGRWWVRGHIRAQWCPSTKTHKLIYIAPFVKGPEDKPFLEKVYHVVR